MGYLESIVRYHVSLSCLEPSPSASLGRGIRDWALAFLASSSSDELDSSPGRVEKSLTVRRGLEADGAGVSVGGLLMTSRMWATPRIAAPGSGVVYGMCWRAPPFFAWDCIFHFNTSCSTAIMLSQMAPPRIYAASKLIPAIPSP